MSGMDPALANLQRTPAEKAARAVLPVSAVIWTAAEIMHATGVHCAVPLGGATALAAAVAWGKAGRDENFPQSLPWWIAVTGGWLTAAGALGPLAWMPAPVLTMAWLVIALAAHRAANRHEAVVSARTWRAARADWLEKRHRWGLGGSHLLDYRETCDDRGMLVSEWYLISTKGTGKRASQFGHATAELIAEEENLPPARVRITANRLAGRLEILVIRAAEPFAADEPHPLAAGGNPELLPVPWRISEGPVRIGKSLEIPLWGKTGAKTVNIVSIRGWGKTVVLNSVSERITAAEDAIQVRINLSDKGRAEAERWGPACHLTAFGPQQQARAVQVLRAVKKIMEWRSARYAVTFYEPSPADPLIVVIIDESDSAMRFPAVRELVDDIATKGREDGVALVKAGQRGTNDYSSGKQKSQDEVTVTGAVRDRREARYAAGDAAYSTPDMAALSEGNPGVWSVAELGGAQQRGRAWLLERADSARLAAGRAMTQPELHPDCAAFLGEPYQELLGTEVFTRWAHAQDDDSPDGPDFVRVDARALQAARVQGDGTAREPADAAGDPLQRMWDADMDDSERARVTALNQKLAGARQMIAETAALPKPLIAPEVREANAVEAWHQVGEDASIPEDARPRLLGMLAEGTTAPAVSAAFGISKWEARQWLENLRNNGAAFVDGERRGARWRLAPPPEEGNAQ